MGWSDDDVRELLGHWPRVYAYALARSRSTARAEDLCQEAYLRLWRSPRRPRSDVGALPMLLTIVRNLDVAESRRPRMPALDEAPQQALPDERRSDPAAAAGRDEALDRLLREVRGLPSSWSEALFLREGLDLSYREIARITGRSEEAIRVTLFRARRRLRELVQPCDGKEDCDDRCSDHVLSRRP